MQAKEVEVYKAFSELFSSNLRKVVLEDGFTLKKLDFSSKHSHLLLEEDRAVESNIRFSYPVFEPKNPSGRPIVIGHGLNEGSYSKLVPWAYHISISTNRPVVIFPLTFHLNRRPNVWVRRAIVFYRKRKDIRTSTPMNAVISHRLETHPERLFLGARQSYYDVLDFVREKGPFDFLGYSLGGFLFLSLLLDGVLEDSKVVVFCSGSRFRDSSPESPLIMDRACCERLKNYYSKWIPPSKEPPDRWFYELFLGMGDLKGLIELNRERIYVVAGRKDKVTPLSSIEENLGTKADAVLDLGIHEVPFTADEEDLKNIDSLHSKLKLSFTIPEKYRDCFQEFIDKTSSFLKNKNS